jgi:16S rRNA processing protein RimM
LEDHASIDDIDYLISKGLYLPNTTLPELNDDQFYYHEIKGFRVIDEVEGDIGPITDVLEYSSQPLIQVDFNGNELLFPISDEVIAKVDKENKIMNVKLTEGLLDIYR